MNIETEINRKIQNYQANYVKNYVNLVFGILWHNLVTVKNTTFHIS